MRKKTTTLPKLSNEDLEAMLETAISRANAPLGVTAAAKALPAGKKPKKEQVQTCLSKLVAAGRIHQWPRSTFWAVSQGSFAQEQVLQALSSAPLTETEIGKKVPSSAKTLVKVALTALVKEGRIHQWPNKYFSDLNPESFAREQVLRVLSSGPLTETEIKNKVPSSAKALVKTALAALVKEGTVRPHPKLGARKPFGLGPPDAMDYLPAELEAAFGKLTKMGFKEAELQRALRRYVGHPDADDGVLPEDREAILAAMARLNSQLSRGALVYLADLRARLTQRFSDKDSFDRAVLELAKQGKVQLQSHAWPGRLSDQEKHALVPNGRGGFFDAIGLRLE